MSDIEITPEEAAKPEMLSQALAFAKERGGRVVVTEKPGTAAKSSNADKPSDDTKTITQGNNREFIKNLGKIAKGQVKVG